MFNQLKEIQLVARKLKAELKTSTEETLTHSQQELFSRLADEIEKLSPIEKELLRFALDQRVKCQSISH